MGGVLKIGDFKKRLNLIAWEEVNFIKKPYIQGGI